MKNSGAGRNRNKSSHIQSLMVGLVHRWWFDGRCCKCCGLQHATTLWLFAGQGALQIEPSLARKASNALAHFTWRNGATPHSFVRKDHATIFGQRVFIKSWSVRIGRRVIRSFLCGVWVGETLKGSSILLKEWWFMMFLSSSIAIPRPKQGVEEEGHQLMSTYGS